MKKVIGVFLALILMVSMVTACEPKAPDSGKDAPVFMFCISHMTNAWAKEASESMQAAAKAAGAELIVNEASQDINKQVGQIESGVTQGVDCIIIEPVSTDGVIPAIEAAINKGIPVIVFNQNISDPSKATCFVGVSNERLGEAQMLRAVDDLKGTGNIAILLGPRGSEGQINRSLGYQKVLAEYPDIEVVFEDEAAWTTEDGLRLAENWLQTGIEINAFVSQNDNMALGAVKALEDKNLQDNCFVYGLDAVPDALQAVKEGRLTITVSQETSKQSQAAIDAAMKLFKGENVPAEILVDIAVVDSSNVDDYQ